jgi:hypothetical protein
MKTCTTSGGIRITGNYSARRIIAAILVTFCIVLGSGTGATAAVTNLTGGAFVPLDFLTAGNQAQVGDKLFSAFTFNLSGDFPAGFGADDLNVIGIQTAGNFGIRFQGGISPNLGGSGDIFLTFDVETTTPGFLISDVHLAYNGGQISAVIEQASDTNGNIMATLQVQNPPPVFQDFALILPPQQELRIQKDIFVRSLGGVVLISNIDQTFSQVPEPSTVGLVSAGLLGLLVIVRRRHL